MATNRTIPLVTVKGPAGVIKVNETDLEQYLARGYEQIDSVAEEPPTDPGGEDIDIDDDDDE
jgi:hypothetical protein